MLIDVHGHVSAPADLYAYKSNLLAHRGAHGRGGVKLSDDQLHEALQAPNPSFGNISHLDHLEEAGIDLQLISPRPYQQMHSESPVKLVEWFTEETNNIIARHCELYPDTFRGVAGIPQSPHVGPENCLKELERAITELGFVGCLLNSDPAEGEGPTPPGLGDRYWYPLYEKLCELDVPALLHSAGCRSPREPYSLHFIIEETISVIHILGSNVFEDFPDLKLIISHGGGAVPYQLGRFQAGRHRRGAERFEESLRRMYFDTCLYTRDALELLFRTVGTDRALFGSEKPGTGSVKNPDNGRWMDDIKPLIDEIDWLTDDDRQRIFTDNASELFQLDRT